MTGKRGVAFSSLRAHASVAQEIHVIEECCDVCIVIIEISAPSHAQDGLTQELGEKRPQMAALFCAREARGLPRAKCVVDAIVFLEAARAI